MIKDLYLDADIKTGESSFSFYEKPESITVNQLLRPSKSPYG